MITITILTLGALWATAVLWVLYIAVMHMRRVRSRLGLPAKVLGYPVLALGLVVDCAYNVTIGTVLFMQPPREWTLTARLQKNIEKYPRWRGKVARWMCDELIEPFDPGHCR